MTMQEMAKELTTERTILRLLVPENDVEEFHALVERDREALSKWLPWAEGMKNIHACVAFLDSMEIQADMGNGGLWGIFVQGHLVGAVAIHWIQWDHASASLGYWLESCQQGKGYAREAVARIVRYCFDDLKLHRLELSTATENAPSAHLAESLGFQEEGIRRHAERLHGVFLDHKSFALLDNDGYAGKHFPDSPKGS